MLLAQYTTNYPGFFCQSYMENEAIFHIFFFNIVNGRLNELSAPHDFGNKMLIQNNNVKIT